MLGSWPELGQIMIFSVSGPWIMPRPGLRFGMPSMLSCGLASYPSCMSELGTMSAKGCCSISDIIWKTQLGPYIRPFWYVPPLPQTHQGGASGAGAGDPLPGTGFDPPPESWYGAFSCNDARNRGSPGGKLPVELWTLCSASEICFKLLVHFNRAAASRTFWTAGRSRPIRTAMIAMTTSSSIRVNPDRVRLDFAMTHPP